ncbi:MAG: hypothetical protein EZS28_023103 [Streblomastix strix]|uniref:Uncharacterized protein n=1 Tax=Streblomastix strix TaxID=222440 RepID=A0A5J4VG57_9EUKA|nr:MAG: hypothetical protein EZS28_023103 [Streblomastix strix]
MEVPTRRPNIDIRMPSSNDGNIFKHVHDLIHTLSTSDEGQLKEILRDLTLQCASSHDISLLLVREHIVEKIISIWHSSDDKEIQSEEKAIMEAGTRELCQLLEQVNDIIQGNNQVGIILGWVLDSLSAKRPLNKSSEEQEDIKNSAAVIIGRLYKTREIENQQMRTEIIEYLKTIVGNADEWNNNESRKALKGLAQNAVNRTVIEAGGFIIPERNEN